MSWLVTEPTVGSRLRTKEREVTLCTPVPAALKVRVVLGACGNAEISEVRPVSVLGVQPRGASQINYLACN